MNKAIVIVPSAYHKQVKHTLTLSLPEETNATWRLRSRLYSREGEGVPWDSGGTGLASVGSAQQTACVCLSEWSENQQPAESRPSQS